MTLMGHGMNDAELAANVALNNGYFVQDLNSKDLSSKDLSSKDLNSGDLTGYKPCVLPLQSDSMDAVLCCAGIMYLTRPVDVLREVGGYGC